MQRNESSVDTMQALGASSSEAPQMHCFECSRNEALLQAQRCLEQILSIARTNEIFNLPPLLANL